MLDCLVLGDSIAVGVGQARPECRVVAVSGITSERFVQTLLAAQTAEIVVISLGVNDGAGMDTFANLRRLRAAVTARTVYWLLPGTNPHVREAIRAVATLHPDRLIDVAPLAGADGLHPDRAGYAVLAEQTREATDRGAPAASAYRDFVSPGEVYRAFPGVTVWRGPYNANGRYVPGSGQP
jgi:lysophospholipase L1-like esterase